MMNRATFVLANCRQFGTILLAIVLATIARSGVSQLAETPIETSIGQRVFFTGHSFHMFVASRVKELASSAGLSKHQQIGTQGIGGSRVIQHWDLPDEKNKAKQALISGEVDVFTMASHIQLPDQGIENFTKLALEHNPRIRLLVQASWMPFDIVSPEKRIKVNAERDNTDLSALRISTDRWRSELESQIDELNKRYGKIAVFIVPVGDAIFELRQQIAAGTFPGISKPSELFRDPIGHGLGHVQALAAYCNFAAIYRRSPEGLQLNEPGVDATQHAILQRIAWQVVSNYPRSGVSSPFKEDMNGIEQTNLWTSGQDGYHTYRIPSLLVTSKGSVLAFCEGRKTGSGDHGDLDLVMKRSTDGGRTWSPQKVVHEEGGDAKITIGNPCPVVDRTDGTIWLPMCRDNKEVSILSSTDDGLSWSAPKNISSSVVRPDWTWVATGPGIGIQLQRGPNADRLVIPCDHKRSLPSNEHEINSHVMISDDHGQSWRITQSIQPGGNECQVVERFDGSLLINTRMQGGFLGYRGTSTSIDGGESWTAIELDKQLPCPKCQGSLIRYDSLDNAQSCLLFSNPHPPASSDDKPSGKRVNLMIRMSLDEGKTWPIARLLHKGPAAYSSLASLSDGTVLCLYEGGEKSAYQSLRLARFSLKWLAN